MFSTYMHVVHCGTLHACILSNYNVCIFLVQLQLQSALLNASSGVVQSLAAQTNIPATILSSALLNANMAATLTAASSNSGEL